MNPFLTYGEHLEHMARFGLAYLLIGFLFLLDLALPSSLLSKLSQIPFFLMAIYYWSLYRPTILPIWLVFAAGIIFDVLSGIPLGLGTALFVILRQIITQQRRFLAGQTFPVVWLGFSLIFTGFLFLQWMCMSIINQSFAIPPGIGMTIVASTALFPLVNFVLHAAHKFLPAPKAHMRLR